MQQNLLLLLLGFEVPWITSKILTQSNTLNHLTQIESTNFVYCYKDILFADVVNKREVQDLLNKEKYLNQLYKSPVMELIRAKPNRGLDNCPERFHFYSYTVNILMYFPI